MFVDPFTLFCLIILALVFYYTHYFITHQRLPPGPVGLPILGYLPFLDIKYPHVTLTKVGKKYGPIYGLYMGSVYTVVLCDAGLMREALKQDVFTARAPLYITHGIMGGFGLICSEGELWKNQRKFATECLKKVGANKYGASRTILEKRIFRGVAECLESIQELNKTSTEIDPMDFLHHAMGNIINDLVFGLTYERDDETWEYLQHLQEEGIKYIGVSGVVNFLPFLRYLPHNKKIIKFLLDGKEKTHKIYDKIIRNVQKMINGGGSKDRSDTGLSFVELFLREKIKLQTENDLSVRFFNDSQMKHFLADLYGASIDTTLTTLRWIILYVALNQDVQKKIQEEFKQFNMPPTLEDYDRLIYLRACIAEGQRIRSTIPLGIPHGTTEDTILCGYKIPKGTMIMPLQWAIHMNENDFEDPERFDPTRFINENGQFQLPPNFAPFQSGKRMCPGEEFAKMILFLFTSNILYNYHITVDDPDSLNMKGRCGITLIPPPYELIFTKVNKFN